MTKLFYKPEDAWVGDLIPYYDNGIYYAFYLHDPRIRGKEYAEETTWHLATTADFKEMNYQGVAIARGADDRSNKNIYTGSVVKDQNGVYHAFYTAYNPDVKVNGKSIQSVMQAVGTDLTRLKTAEDFLFLADGKKYEQFDWRDPYVFWHQEENCYYMLLAARRKNGGDLRGGVIALCKSEDLYEWTYEEPFYEPRMYITMECPEVFRMGNYWYMVFSTFSDRFTTHYRMAESLAGPWIIPEDDIFDTRANYAIKTASDGKRRYAFGWIASKYGACDFGPWEWGGTMVIHEIKQNEVTGHLYVVPTEAMKNHYNHETETSQLTYYNCIHQDSPKPEIESETLGSVLFDLPKDCFSLEMEIEVKQAREFGIALHTDAGMERGYFLRMNSSRHEMAWDMWPRSEKGLYQWQIKGDVPYQVETARVLPVGNTFRILVIREEDICVVYVNDQVAMSTRMYDHKDGMAGLYIVQGKAKLLSYQIKEMAQD